VGAANIWLTIRPFAGSDRLTELDAAVAYLQVLGELSLAPYTAEAAS
jgi:cytochrome c oxidase cbb3-type subunit II